MIPARLPREARVAHKTGEISTACHDAGIVQLPDRQPYIVAILSETGPETKNRTRAIAEISAAIHRYVVGSPREEKADEAHE
jgi:beta-lactamase class A